MQETITLKQAAAYVGMGVNLEWKNPSNGKTGLTELTGVSTGINHLLDENHFMMLTIDGGVRNDACRLILRPIEDVIKMVNIKGKTFIPLGELNEEALRFGSSIQVFPTSQFFEIRKQRDMSFYNILKENRWKDKLIAWHFDVFNLIPRGLAIDINTLNN